ncbi:MAG: hypothetical protein Q3971_07475 [Moraxella sp.]|nr:hypothetical protein [Moraxella sp.]
MLDCLEKIKTLYGIDTLNGVSQADIDRTESRVGVLPKVFKDYYQTLGLDDNINRSFNKILSLDEMDFADDYLVIAKENQAVCHWGIYQGDLHQDNPKVYVCYDIDDDNPTWHIENNSVCGFFMMMGFFNATMGGIKYHANYMGDKGNIKRSVIDDIKEHWQEIPNIQINDRTCYFTKDFKEILILCFDDNDECNGVFLASGERSLFDEYLAMDIDWSYVCDEDFDEE